MYRTVTADCFDVFYEEWIQPYVDRGYQERDIATALLMAGTSYLLERPEMEARFESVIKEVRLFRAINAKENDK